MAYIPGFKHDIFISYAHVDNAKNPGEEMGWVETFCKYLEVELGKKIGRSNLVNIWWDSSDLDPGQQFDAEIADGVEESAILLALYSNGYQASQYCLNNELKPFFDKANSDTYGMVVGENRRRIYQMLLADINYKEWPKAFEGGSGFPFYDSESPQDVSIPGSVEFRGQMRKLANSLHMILDEFKETAENGSNTAKQPATADSTSKGSTDSHVQTVFIADVPESLGKTARKLVNDLEREDIAVVQRIPPPYETGAHDEEVKKIIDSCALSVHLLDKYPGRTMDEDPSETYRQRQIELIKEASIPQIIWVPKQVDIEDLEIDEGYREFLQDLKNGKRETDEIYEFVRILPTNLKTHVLDKLKKLNEEQQKEDAEAANGEAAGVLVVTHQKDQLHAFNVGSLLVKHQMQPYINPSEDDPSANFNELKTRLDKVKMLMVLYGQVAEGWVRQWLGEVLKMQMTSGLSIKEYCVINVPPEKSDAVNFDFGPIPINTIDLIKGEEDLVAVLDRVRGAAA